MSDDEEVKRPSPHHHSKRNIRSNEGEDDEFSAGEEETKQKKHKKRKHRESELEDDQPHIMKRFPSSTQSQSQSQPQSLDSYNAIEYIPEIIPITVTQESTEYTDQEALEELRKKNIEWERYVPQIEGDYIGADAFHVTGCVAFYRPYDRCSSVAQLVTEPCHFYAVICCLMDGDIKNASKLEVSIEIQCEWDCAINQHADAVDVLNEPEFRGFIRRNFEKTIKKYWDITIEDILAASKERAPIRLDANPNYDGASDFDKNDFITEPPSDKGKGNDSDNESVYTEESNESDGNSDFGEDDKEF